MAGMKGDEDVGELPYREVQHRLKALGLYAKGPDAVLRERLAEALEEPTTAGKEDITKVEAKTIKSPRSPKSPTRSPKKVASPKAQVKIALTKSPTGTAKKHQAAAHNPLDRKAEEEQDSKHEEEEDAKKGGRSRRQIKSPKVGQGSASPVGRKRRSRVSLPDTEIPSTPVQQIKKIARDSTARMRKSFGNIEREMKKRKIPLWLIPALLLLLLLLGSQWRNSMSWHRQMNHELSTLNRNIYSGLVHWKDQSQLQARRLSRSAQHAYEKLYTGVSQSAESVKTGATSAYHEAIDRLRPTLPDAACAARLNTTTLGTLFSEYPPSLGLSTTLQEAWHGYKESSLKATGILLAGRNKEQVQWATTVVKHAVPPDCAHCYLFIQGEEYASQEPSLPGKMQKLFADHIRSCPYAIIHVELVNRIHPDNLNVLLNAMSEQGSVQSNGKNISMSNALFIGSTIVPRQILEKDGEEELASAVKRDLVLQLELASSPSSLVNLDAFRRRWDHVAPILQKVQ